MSLGYCCIYFHESSENGLYGIKLLSSHCIFGVEKYAKSKEVCIFGDQMTLS